ncbi:MAG: molybdopterin-synthase adenylyltransferase MoeB [Gemmatimonadota bacterium]|jgi:adenylyltransferase/sulfurtransferase|nr:molybdopterin-synthase adenylyltransferase MoeB [Gemmatimonadota bacterium]
MSIPQYPESPGFSPEETLRYARHLTLPEVGRAGQYRLKRSRVLVIGAGGLGSPVIMYLAAAGVGTIGVVDFDIVDASNLQRQILHGSSDLGSLKLDSAVETIRELNPHVHIERYPVRLDSGNALEIFADYEVVVDGTDNFPTRYLANDACVLSGKPYVYGSIFRFEGQNSVFAMPGQPCYRCLFAEPPPPGLVPSCEEGGVLGVVPGIVGTIQTMETIKLLLGIGETLAGRVLMFDALRMKFRELRLKRDPGCPVCGDAPTVRELINYEIFCGIQPTTLNRNTNGSMMSENNKDLTPTELKAALDRGEAITLLDVREPHEWEIGNLESLGAKLIPLGDLPDRVEELDPGADLVVYCRSGARSDRAVNFLREQGFTRVRNLTGGIRGWSEEVDSSIPRY